MVSHDEIDADDMVRRRDSPRDLGGGDHSDCRRRPGNGEFADADVQSVARV
jgi:hypothetical protein